MDKSCQTTLPILGRWRAFFYLTKPTITLLVVVTTLPGLVLGESLPQVSLVLAVLVGTAMVSASASAFNQALEGDLDASMNRTYRRSIPAGDISFSEAILFGLAIGVIGSVLLYAWAGPFTLFISLAAHLFYTVFYTSFLKLRTAQNIVIGGMAGAVGPLIGYAAVSNTLSWEAWILFLVITMWTPPHFWALALKYRDDYARVKIPMYPVVYGVNRTKREILLYTLTLLPIVASLYLWDKAGLLYISIAGPLSVKFVWDAWQIYRAKDENRIMPFFHFSCTYIFWVFGALTVDRLITFL